MSTATVSNRPHTGEVEERSVDGGAACVDGRRLRGLIPYGVESRDLGGWTEVIDPGALANTRLDDLIATREHDRAHLLGRYPTTLQTEDRSDGFAWSCELPSSPVGEDVRVAVQRGDLRASSWRMVVDRDYWVGDVRHVADIAELHDVTVTAQPAYGDQARAEYRSLPLPEEAAMTATETAEAAATEITEAESEDRSTETEDRSEDRSAEERPSTRRTGRLRVEDRSAAPPPRPIEDRIIESMRAIPAGESRSLTDANLSLVAPPELSTYLWDLLRPQSVVLESGIRIVVTDRQQVEFPRQTADPTAAFYNELDPITESDPAFDQITVTPKAIKALVRGSSEAFEDSSPDLLTLLEANLNKILALKLDAALLFGSVAADAKSFDGMDTVAGTSTIAWGSATNWDPILKACGHLAGAHVPPPYHLVMHPWAETALSLIKKFSGSIASNEGLEVPDGIPPRSTTSLIPITSNTSTGYVYAPQSIAFVRRRDVTIEVDRSQEFTNDSVLVRGKLRGAPVFPYPQAVVKVTSVPTPDPTS